MTLFLFVLLWKLCLAPQLRHWWTIMDYLLQNLFIVSSVIIDKNTENVNIGIYFSSYDFHDLFVDAPAIIARIAKEMGVERFIHFSHLNADPKAPDLIYFGTDLPRGNSSLRKKVAPNLKNTLGTGTCESWKIIHAQLLWFRYKSWPLNKTIDYRCM